MTSGPRWTLLYDADCGFCKWTVALVLAWDRGGRLSPRAIQGVEGDRLLSDLDPDQRLATSHLVSPDGERLSDGAAAPPLLRLLPGGRALALPLARFPRLTARTYRWVAEHRTQLSRAVPSGAKRRGAARVARAEAER